MTHTSISRIDDISSEELAAFKAFAAVNSDLSDGLLASLLQTAYAAASQYCWRALKGISVRQDERNADGDYLTDIVLINGDISDISAVDGDGTPLEIQRKDGAFYAVSACDAVITYQVDGRAGVRERVIVWKYAAALYDGKDASELDKILRELL